MNKVKITLLTAICIATAFTFLACEKKDKKADPGGGEAKAAQEEAGEGDCPNKIGSPQTAEATFLETYTDGEGLSMATFRLADGNEINLNCDEELIKDMKKGAKASITYQKIGADFGDGCVHLYKLESVK